MANKAQCGYYYFTLPTDRALGTLLSFTLSSCMAKSNNLMP